MSSDKTVWPSYLALMWDTNHKSFGPSSRDAGIGYVNRQTSMPPGQHHQRDENSPSAIFRTVLEATLMRGVAQEQLHISLSFATASPGRAASADPTAPQPHSPTAPQPRGTIVSRARAGNNRLTMETKQSIVLIDRFVILVNLAWEGGDDSWTEGRAL